MLSRREFLRRLTLGGLALSTVGCGSSFPELAGGPRFPIDPPSTEVDLAVIGAGMSGLYSAWRVLNAAKQGWNGLGDSPRVAVFEASPRIGGRLSSLPTQDLPQIPAEIGGMRILLGQPLVNNLVRILGIPVTPFPTGGGDNLYYLREQRFTTKQLKEGGAIPYSLAPREQRLTPGDLLDLALADVLPDIFKITRAEWLGVKKSLTYDGRPLYDQVYADVLRSRLSPDGYDLLYDGLGYLGDFNQLNAAEMFQNAAEFGDGFVRVIEGFQSLPLRLAEEVRELGGEVTTEMPLLHLASSPDGYVLNMASNHVVRARSVILAVPPAAIMDLDPTSAPFSVAGFRDDLQAVQPQRASRLFLAFRQPWWKSLGIRDGFSRTDLPLRQCVYFGTESEQPGGDPNNSNSLLLATFSEAEAGVFWADFLERPSDPFPSVGVPTGLQAPRPLVEEALRQLEQLHGVSIPQPYWASFIDWSVERTAASYHFWRPGYRSWEVIPRVGNPLPGLYVAGEAFSTNQAWVEGALDNAEETLQFKFGLAPPDGISPAYAPANFRQLVRS